MKNHFGRFVLVLLIALLRAIQLFRRGGAAAPAGEGAAQ